jgi:hypothetical protein
MEDKLKKLDDTSETSSVIAHSWNNSHEKLLAAIGDRANGMRWMHNQSYIFYEKLNFWFTIPNVAVTALAGSASIGFTTLFSGTNQTVVSLIIGLMTLSSSVLTTINQYMKTSQLAESHRIACIAYGKLHRIVSSELALRRDQRINAQAFLEVVREEQNRLEEASPVIQTHIVRQFNMKIKDKPELERPEISGDLDHITVNTSIKEAPPISAIRQSSVETPRRLPYIRSTIPEIQTSPR